MISGGIALLAVTGYGVFTYNKSQERAALDALAPATQVIAGQTYSLTDVALHASTHDCWIAINGKVYDVTKYIASGMHNPEIEKGCGRDATNMFSQERKHQGEEAADIMAKLYIGNISL